MDSTAFKHADNHPVKSTFPEIHFQPHHLTDGVELSHRRQGSLTDIQFQPKASIGESDGFQSQESCSEIDVIPRNEIERCQLLQMNKSPSACSRSSASERLVRPRKQSENFVPPSDLRSFAIPEAKEIDLTGIFPNGEGWSLNKAPPPLQIGGSIWDEQEENSNASDTVRPETPSLQLFFARQNGRVGTRSALSTANSRLGLSLHNSRRVGLSTSSIRSGKSFVSQRSVFSGSNNSRDESHGSLSFYCASSRLDCTSEEGEPTYLAPAPESEPFQLSETPQLDDEQELQEIEVGPGCFLRLRGARETWAAMIQEKCVRAFCPYCGIDMLFIFDAEFVLCPVCRDISPSDVGCEGGGIGLGVNIDELYPNT